MWFKSDNAGPAAPEILEALTRANEGYALPYGEDEAMTALTARIRDVFSAPDAEVRLVATGTAANVLSLATLCPPWATTYCHRHAHIFEDEASAFEFYTGGRMTPVDGDDGRIAPDALAAAMARTEMRGVHGMQRGPLSLTNATELGTVYGPDGIAALSTLARRYGVPVHLDGARFANALIAQGARPAEASWKAGVDILCLGGTKNGLLGVEAVVIFDHARAREFDFRRKRAGHLVSKHRYLAAQMLAWLEDGLWLDLARRANAMAARLGAGLAQVPAARVLHPVEANAVFVALPRAAHRRLHEAGARYYFWSADDALEGADDTMMPARLVCNWATTQAEVDGLLGLLAP